MKCPYCEREMEAGYVQCRDGVYWTPKKQFIAALSCFGKGSTSLANGAADNGRTVRAHKCAACRSVVIRYGESDE